MNLLQYASIIMFFIISLTGTGSVSAGSQEKGKSFNPAERPAYMENARKLGMQKKEKVPNAIISGQILIKGKTPMANGVVFLFDKSTGPPPCKQDIYWRVPDRIVAIDKSGGFSFEVHEGIYYLTAAQKDPDSDIGPPEVDELHYFHGDDEGNPLPIIVSSGSNLKLGVLVPFLWSPNMIKRDKGITAAEGVVSDMDGNPVAGALVFAYLSEDTTGRPVFISDKTDNNGKYLLRVHDGGIFYLKVRSVYGGGAPEPGEFLNITEEFKPFMVTLQKGQKMQQVNLTVKKFSKRGPNNTTPR